VTVDGISHGQFGQTKLNAAAFTKCHRVITAEVDKFT